MKMKFITVTIFSLLLGSAAIAQKEPSVFVKAGFNMANISVTESGNIDEARMLPSFHAGLQGDIPVIKNVLSIQPGLFFTGKGSKFQQGSTSDASYYRETTNPMYLEVPVNVVVKAPVGGDARFFAGAGPYVAMGIAGRNKVEGKVFGVNFSSNERIDFSNDDPTTSPEEGAGYGILRRFDYGLNGTIGFEGESAIFSINYGLGLAKVQSGTNNNADDKNKHRVLSFTIGFRL